MERHQGSRATALVSTAVVAGGYYGGGALLAPARTAVSYVGAWGTYYYVTVSTAIVESAGTWFAHATLGGAITGFALTEGKTSRTSTWSVPAGELPRISSGAGVHLGTSRDEPREPRTAAADRREIMGGAAARRC